jgi:hypothetical protein
MDGWDEWSEVGWLNDCENCLEDGWTAGCVKGCLDVWFEGCVDGLKKRSEVG